MVGEKPGHSCGVVVRARPKESRQVFPAALRRSSGCCALAQELLSEKAARIIFVAPDYLARALEIFQKFYDQDFSFTDCTSLAIMEHLNIQEALAFDGHFTFEPHNKN
ncbi:MAG: type II toxin-antitoxin system VapC family toxin [Bacillota bacterium]